MDKSLAYMDGWTVHRQGGDVELNPYNEELQPFSYRHWNSGWRERYSARKHGQSTVELDERYE